MNIPPKKKKRRRKGADRLPLQPRELHLPSLFPEFPNDEVLMEISYTGIDGESIADVSGNYDKFSNPIVLIETNR